MKMWKAQISGLLKNEDYQIATFAEDEDSIFKTVEDWRFEYSS